MGGREVDFFRRVEAFAAASRLLTTDKGLADLLSGVCDDLGFKFFALVHHTDIRSAETISLHNYPDSWVDYFVKNNLFTKDPIHRASNTTNLGFAWSNVRRMIKTTSDDQEVFRLSRLAGIGDGFTIPAHIPGEVNGSCSFATSSDRELQQNQMPVAQVIGSFAFEAARRLVRRRAAGTDKQNPPLTPRQRQCVALVAQGKSDWEISRILGISHETVIQHIKQARERYGVSKRTMLAVRALYDGSISFDEAMGGRRDGPPHFLV